jgi:ribosomal protein L21E
MVTIQTKDVVRIIECKSWTGKTGVVVSEHGDSVCVVLTKVWDHGLWFDKNQVKRIGKIK